MTRLLCIASSWHVASIFRRADPWSRIDADSCAEGIALFLLDIGVVAVCSI